ncbi:MAG TPA: hypothetical protein VER79_05610 [Candidatus Limnocylindrales bacterium]|nr:hypothetical protein [Candidatus Limnocylindrales bacterium]
MTPPDDAYYAALEALIRPRAAEALPATLAPMQALLLALGHPEQGFPVVVVAGSTGKGTTALRLAAGLAGGGLRVGLYTSPHLHSFRERFAVVTSPPGPLSVHTEGETIPVSGSSSPLPEGEGQGVRAITSLISPASFVVHAHAVQRAAALDQPLSTFEAATALALCWFAGQAVDVAVCEIGLGGRFDAVNAADHALALIGPIELEHAAMLGGTLVRIAWHKAGVIPAGGSAIAAPPADDRVRAVFEREAAEKGAHLTYATDLAQAGLAWLQEWGLAPATAAIPTGAALPGRLERVTVGKRTVLIDGGHTQLAARRLAETLAPDLPGCVRMVAGILADKDAGAYLPELDMPGLTLVLTTAPAGRAQPAAALAETFRAQHVRVEVEPSFDAALAAALIAPEALIAVAGSLRTAAAAREALGLLNEEALEEARRTRALFEGPGYRAKWGG